MLSSYRYSCNIQFEEYLDSISGWILYMEWWLFIVYLW